MYRNDCGFDAFSANARKAKFTFDNKYRFRGVSWDGYVVRVSLNDNLDPISQIAHASTILIKLDEDDREGVHGADIGLSLSEHVLSLYTEEVGSLHIGDHLRFNATMSSMGDHTHLHHLRGFHIEKLPGHRDVEAHASAHGRYKVKYEHDQKKEEPVQADKETVLVDDS